ncbi:MAG: tetratricopeptide repeat protein [bacterium]
MSLLLDALKKAAEQKAEKSREDIPEAETSDETIVVSAPEDISEIEEADKILTKSQSKPKDETELDDSRLQTQLEDTQLERGVDDTSIEIPDATETHDTDVNVQMQTQLEDTHLEPGVDDTSIEIPDATETQHTDVNTQMQTQLEDTQLERGVDDTSIEIPDATETQHTDLSTQMQTGEDETIVFDEEDVSDFMGEPELVNRESQAEARDDQTEIQTHIEARDEAPAADETEFDPTSLQTHVDSTQLDSAADETEFDQTQHRTNIQPEDPDATSSSTELDQAESQEDMSLLLVERDDTNFTARTSLTDPQTLEDRTETLKSDDAESEELALIDTTRHNLPGEATQTQSAMQTSATGTNVDTQSTATRADSTGTYTYAPDNYDRTLMKLPSEDASKLFAGMKNESDAVMTPDYAKKVFRSKSSAQRLYNVKIYAGIMVAIILGIGIFGAFEFQDESQRIDTSLRPLKRDPMPGMIKSGSQEQDTNLFNEPEPAADVRTIEIVENAESVTGMDEVTTGAAEIEEPVATVESESTAMEPETEVAIASVEPTQTTQVTEPQVTSVAQIEVVASEPETSSSNLQISSTSRIGQKDILLREAYDAYKSGDHSLALSRYNQVLDEDPGNRNALLARAAINVQNGDSAAAIKDYQALLLANPTDSLAMASLITVANYSPQDTESQLKLMIRTEPGSPHLNFVLANVYGAQNRWQEAQGHYFTALQSNPGDPNYAYNLAVSLEHISQPGSAITYYRRALENFDNGYATFSVDIVDQRLELLEKK